jgi:hypothetical protein
MGITIHWELEAPSESAQAAAAKLERVRRVCLKLPFEEVGKVEHIPPKTCKTVPKRKKRKDDLYWAVFCARKYVPTGRGYRAVRPLEVVRLPLLAGEECDTTNLVLARYPGEEGWSGQGNTKTQYATHFVESHLLVIAALDACKAAGILKEVEDEGGFWTTRDMTTLARNITASTDMIRRVYRQFRRALGSRVVSPIESCRNYVRVAGERR